MLIGQFEGKIGDKSRVAFPKRFRSILGDSLIITKGFERSLIIVSEKNYTSLLEGTSGKPFTKKPIREMQRYLLGGASFVELDSKGRFIIPEYLKSHASLDSDLLFVGVQRYVEVWDKTLWAKQDSYLSEKIESIAEKLSESTDE